MTSLRVLALALALVVGLAAQTNAQQVKSFAVAPFSVNGPEKFNYLGQSVQTMLTSRLAAPGIFTAVDKAVVDQKVRTAPKTVEDAKKALNAVGGDYLVYGAISVVGEQASVDITVLDRTGKTWPKAVQTSLPQFIPSLEAAAKEINSEVFGRSAGAGGKGGKEAMVNPNPAFVVNQADASQPTYLNPNFRYAGNPESEGYWRSQSLPFASTGMAVGDLDGDGQNEIIISSASVVHVFKFKDRQLTPVATYDVGTRNMILNVVYVNSTGRGAGKIAVSVSFDRTAHSAILELQGNKLVALGTELPYYFGQLNMPPDFKRKQLIVSKSDQRDLFQRGVYEANIVSGKVQLSGRIELPSKANCFNVAYLPDEKGYKTLIVNSDDRIEVYTGTGDKQYQSQEPYAGSGVGLEFDKLMGPMTKPDPNYLWNYYYIPLPMLVTNMGSRWQVIANKNITVAGQFFQNFRSFPQGELHSMYWDGVGLSLLWKTRRIMGTVSSYAIGDVMNAGSDQLIIALNTYPGPTGMGDRRTFIQAYPLDTESAARNAKTGPHPDIQ